MKACAVSWVDVFSVGPMSGNLLAVVHDADGLNGRVLALAARRFGLAETSFVLQPRLPATDYLHRIFTVAGELPFAGHPSLGTAAAVARRRGATSLGLQQETQAGVQQLRVEASTHGDGVTVRMEQPGAELGPVLDALDLTEALGLPPSAAHPSLLPQLASIGLPAVIVPLSSAAFLPRIRIAPERMAAVLRTVGDAASLNCYVAAELSPGRWQARCFAADIAGGEDPATGSAAGALGGYLQRHLGVGALQVEQGLEMAMPSRIFVDSRAGCALSGEVRFRGEGTLWLPETLSEI